MAPANRIDRPAKSVRNGPGSTIVTRIPNGATSPAALMPLPAPLAHSVRHLLPSHTLGGYADSKQRTKWAGPTLAWSGLVRPDGPDRA